MQLMTSLQQQRQREANRRSYWRRWSYWRGKSQEVVGLIHRHDEKRRPFLRAYNMTLNKRQPEKETTKCLCCWPTSQYSLAPLCFTAQLISSYHFSFSIASIFHHFTHSLSTIISPYRYKASCLHSKIGKTTLHALHFYLFGRLGTKDSETNPKSPHFTYT